MIYPTNGGLNVTFKLAYNIITYPYKRQLRVNARRNYFLINMM